MLQSRGIRVKARRPVCFEASAQQIALHDGCITRGRSGPDVRMSAMASSKVGSRVVLIHFQKNVRLLGWPAPATRPEAAADVLLARLFLSLAGLDLRRVRARCLLRETAVSGCQLQRCRPFRGPKQSSG
jgi:hypothetical protein